MLSPTAHPDGATDPSIPTREKELAKMSFVSEFKEFVSKGNVMDMAVGIIIGAGFGKIVSSFVADIVMPPIGLLMGGVDFTELKVVLQEAQGDVAAVTLNYGSFIQNMVDFLIVALAVFIAIKMVNSLKKNEEAAPPAEPSAEEKLLTEIRDLLQK